MSETPKRVRSTRSSRLNWLALAAFAVLLALALLSISLVLAARMSFPRPHDFDLPPALKPRAWPGLFGSTSRSGSVPTSR